MSALAGDRLINTRNLKLTVLLFVSWSRQPNTQREWKMPLPEHGAAEGVQHTARACKHPANTDPHKLLHLPWAFWHPQAEWCCLFPWSSTWQFLYGTAATGLMRSLQGTQLSARWLCCWNTMRSVARRAALQFPVAFTPSAISLQPSHGPGRRGLQQGALRESRIELTELKKGGMYLAYFIYAWGVSLQACEKQGKTNSRSML